MFAGRGSEEALGAGSHKRTAQPMVPLAETFKESQGPGKVRVQRSGSEFRVLPSRRSFLRTRTFSIFPRRAPSSAGGKKEAECSNLECPQGCAFQQRVRPVGRGHAEAPLLAAPRPPGPPARVFQKPVASGRTPEGGRPGRASAGETLVLVLTVVAVIVHQDDFFYEVGRALLKHAEENREIKVVGLWGAGGGGRHFGWGILPSWPQSSAAGDICTPR